MKILITESDGFSPRALARLSDLGEVRPRDLDRAGLLDEIRHADILWIRLRHYIGREIMDAAPSLRIIATPTTGLTHIDLAEAERRSIGIVSLRGQTKFLEEIRATAEHTVGLMLALMRHIPQAHAHSVAGGWNRDLFQGHELHRKTVGIVGYGRLGRIVARYLNAFDCKILASDRPDQNPSTDPWVRLVPLSELLSHSDIVSLHVNLDSGTKGLIDRSCFEQMKPGAWFINTARGELIDEAALLDSLESGRLAGAALDVLCDEHVRIAEHPLIAYAARHDNLLVTPHIGGCTGESMEKTEEFLAEQLAQLVSR
ncbi:MAG: NAD(P)-dependent oxidoreductase [Bryobacteraceae bacterium]